MTLSTRVAHERLTRICFIDYDREMALVAQHQDSQSGNHDIIGVGRLSKARGTNEAEFALSRQRPLSAKGNRNSIAQAPHPGRPRSEYRPDHWRHPARE